MSRHGTSSRYNEGCRCSECRRAWADAQSRYRERRRAKKAGLADATPVWRMIDELVTFGIPKSRIARALGRRDKAVDYSRDRMQRKTAEAVEELHWLIWRNHAPFRDHCWCSVPDHIAEAKPPEGAA